MNSKQLQAVCEVPGMCWLVHMESERVCRLRPAHTINVLLSVTASEIKPSSNHWPRQIDAERRCEESQNGPSQRGAERAEAAGCAPGLQTLNNGWNNGPSAHFKVLLFLTCALAIMTQQLIYKLGAKALVASSCFRRSCHRLAFVCTDFRCGFHLHCLWSGAAP